MEEMEGGGESNYASEIAASRKWPLDDPRRLFRTIFWTLSFSLLFRDEFFMQVRTALSIP